MATRVYKPGSVLTAIYLGPKLLLGSSRLLGAVGQTICSSTALLRDRVYIVKPVSLQAGWALTPPFHPYHPSPTLSERPWRYISVALVLGSPPAGVTRYPCPVKPGLSSRPAFRHGPAAVRPGRSTILLHEKQLVKHLAKSFIWEYTMINEVWQSAIKVRN